VSNAIRHIAKLLLRFIVLWVVDTISLIVAAALLGGLTISGGVAGAAGAALMLSLINLLIRPLILLVALPLGFFVTFGVGFIVNALALLIAGALLPNFDVSGIVTAFLGGLIFSAVNTVIVGALTLDDEDSFYQGVVERLAKREAFQGADTGRGLVMLEIDGLSYHHVQKAIAAGYMPTLKQMIEEEGYALSHVDCGLPSQTSACQAGIMFGDNFDIPSFRWYDKEQQKLYVSGKDAAQINARYAKGNGLMRGGSSINNMLNGDAEKSILTMADLKGGEPDENKRRAHDIYLLMLNPYFVMRTLALFVGDMLREVWEYRRDKAQGVTPLLNRTHHFYPAVRAATTTFMRDISAYLTILDIVRGSPSIYVTWPGYDEVAHHSLPWSSHAFRTLRQYDRVIARVRDIIARKAPRPYELVILSDHGQSSGPTFLMRYSYSLKEFIEQQLPKNITVSHSSGGDDGTLSMTAMVSELSNVQQQGMGGAVGGVVIKQTQKVLDRGVEKQSGGVSAPPAQVTVCGSGNIAQVYFDLYPRKITLNELKRAYPGMVDALVAHEGVGFVVTYDDAGTPIALGKQGQRNLHTGAVIGSDPFKPYGPPDFRAQQVRRIADYPHAGDLIVNSTLYPDGTVAAMEELIGSHGGLGGEQTDAFLLHPNDYDVPATSNSADVFPILNARRGLPATAPQAKAKTMVRGIDAWSPRVLLTGIGRVGQWLGRAAGAFTLDRNTYRDIVRDPYMTGPAIVIGLLGGALATLASPQGDVTQLLGRWALWILTALLLFGAGRLMGGKATFTGMFQVIGFAQIAHLLDLLAFIPPIAPLARFVAILWAIFAAWIGAAEAHELRGWRSLILPLVALGTLIVAMIVLRVLVQGAAFTLDVLLQGLGLAP
jgi:uncharacterized membrane protein YvlD (DUF360 family)